MPGVGLSMTHAASIGIRLRASDTGAEHPDTQALHAKTDELLRAVGKADSETVKFDKEEPEEIERERERKQQ